MSLRTIRSLLCLALALLPLAAAHGQQADRTLRVGESDVCEFQGMTTAAVGNPAVVDIVPLSSCRLLVNAKGAGETTLFVYDRQGRHRLRFAVVSPAPDLGPAAAQIQTDIGLPHVTARAIKDTVFLEGTVPSVVALQRAGAIAGVYAPRVRNLLAVVPEKGEAETSLAQTYAALLTDSLGPLGIKVQVMDEDTLALSGNYAPAQTFAAPEDAPTPKARARRVRAHKTSGSRAGAGDDTAGDEAADAETPLETPPARRAPAATGGDPLGRMLASLPPELRVVDLINLGGRPSRQILVHAKIIAIDRSASKSLGINWGSLQGNATRGGNAYTFIPQPILFGQVSGQTADSYGYNFLSGGGLKRIAPLAALLNLLISENKARILSEPSLMVLDGSEGSILVGGEIPIPVAQSSNGTSGVSATVTIEYKPYGVRLGVGASLVGDGAVQMTVSPEVSDLNYAAGVQISGFLVPGLSVRRATTTLQMADGETLVIGGLYSSTTSRAVERIPLLSQIPILGEFFKSTTTRKEETELLILIQPEIVRPDTADARPPAPGSRENPSIGRPDVAQDDFDRDFPDLQHSRDHEKPGPPVNLPPVPAPPASLPKEAK